MGGIKFVIRRNNKHLEADQDNFSTANLACRPAEQMNGNVFVAPEGYPNIVFAYLRLA